MVHIHRRQRAARSATKRISGDATIALLIPFDHPIATFVFRLAKAGFQGVADQARHAVRRLGACIPGLHQAAGRAAIAIEFIAIIAFLVSFFDPIAACVLGLTKARCQGVADEPIVTPAGGGAGIVLLNLAKSRAAIVVVYFVAIIASFLKLDDAIATLTVFLAQGTAFAAGVAYIRSGAIPVTIAGFAKIYREPA